MIPRGCKFVLADDVKAVRPDEIQWCGRPRREGSSYCEEHHRLCHRPTRDRLTDHAA